MRAYSYSPIQCAEYLLDDSSADLMALHDLRRRAREGRLRIMSAPWSSPPEQEVHIVSETPVEGPGAVARWVALLDRAEHLQQDNPSDHPTVQRQIARAIDSLFLYEHQMLPAARREAREYVWRRDRTESLPAPQLRTAWEQCRCRTCLLARLMTRSAVAKQLGVAAAGGADPCTPPPASTPAALRQTRRPHSRCPAQRRLLPSEARAS
jgi:hypothetical protein